MTILCLLEHALENTANATISKFPGDLQISGFPSFVILDSYL